ncbi:MAG: exosortase E/protease, VPEID-CTERM system [Terracidiphilus sp.]
MVLEYLFCFQGRGTILGHLKLFSFFTSAYGEIPLFAFIVFLVFGHSRLKAQRETIAFSRILFCSHLVCIAAVVCFTMAMHGFVVFSALLFDTFSYTKSALYVLATVLLAFALIPLQSWIAAIRATGRLWLYATFGGFMGCVIGSATITLWSTTGSVQGVSFLQRTTLQAVAAVLGIFTKDMVIDPSTFLIGTSRYQLIIAGGCSGVEGFGLVLVFTTLWLWVYRKEIRFPQALLLIPCSLACSWLLNIIRLCLLILIASSGGSEAFENGFHAQFGWVTFIAISVAFSWALQKISWMRKLPPSAPAAEEERKSSGSEITFSPSHKLGDDLGESPAIRSYMIPLLAILAAATLSKLLSGYFDWLYPLRFIAAAIAILCFWPKMKKLDWRFGWLGPVTGAAIFLMWIAPSWFASLSGHPHAAGSLGSDLAALSPSARWAWVAFRVAAAVITVPIAEELAFRGYLARRIMSWDFDQISFSNLTAGAICLSSLVFGIEHMKNLMDWQHLLLGTAAGLAFAGVLRWRGRMGDAVVAHAVSNLLLAAWVLGLGDWSQW